MVTLNVQIESFSHADRIFRAFGLAVDENLPPNFWEVRPDLIIGVWHSPFNYVTAINFAPGSHRITFGNSGYANDARFPDWGWHTTLFINGAPVAEGLVGRHDFLVYSFSINGNGNGNGNGVPPPPPPITLSPLMIGGLIFLVVGGAYMLSRE